MDKRFVDDYKKIKPTADLKPRIMCEILKAEAKDIKTPFYKRMKPILSGALACFVLIACISVIPMNMLGSGDVSVTYARSGELVAPVSTSRAFSIAAYDESGCDYSEINGGLRGAEFTFDFEGKTELKTEFGSVYKKNADGTYEKIDSKTRFDGEVTIFWAMPDDTEDKESVMTLKNRSGEWLLALERNVDTYKANFIKTE
jgi:hypothetical protein